jgi:hemolysin III
MARKSKKRRRDEEFINSLTHGIGIAGAIACTTILIIVASQHSVWHVISCSIFGAGLIFLYTASTFFHGAKNIRKKSKLNIIDHSAIYILIAATFSPLTMVVLHNALGWVIFGLIWAMAIAGIIFKICFYTSKMRKLSAWLYIGMSWPIVIAIVPVIQNMPNISLWFLLIGCMIYAFSTYYYLKRKIPFGHSIFHLLIMCGSTCHFFCFYYLMTKPINL